ncbi:MAG TPA: orotidine-5'-phosphate decarboxylase [Candidatus Limnocylindrales bacterium]|nr:orotidine-5'-phosphate decarboxylase [Candidatus Limnocylindrales bacterium]
MTSAVSSSSLPRAAEMGTAADGSPSYLERLCGRVEIVGTTLCVGIDPEPSALPAGFSRDVRGIEAFCRLLIESTAQHAAAYKANLAFFEAFGSAGLAALERIRAAIPAGIPFVADAKRGDIGSTAARQAVALYDVLGSDAVTVSPYLGREAVEPLIGRRDRFAYVLCRTSNGGAGEFQGLAVDGDPLYVHVARHVSEWSASGATVGLVVGATAPQELERIRSVAPTLPFLVPGVGAQGGEVIPVLQHGPVTAGQANETRGGGLLVNVSRGISSAALEGQDPGVALFAASQRWARVLRC